MQQAVLGMLLLATFSACGLNAAMAAEDNNASRVQGTTQPVPRVFPIPQEITEHANDFALDEQTWILVPEKASRHDLFLARSLCAELVDKHSLALRITHVTSLPKNHRYILVAPISNPLVKQAVTRRKLAISSSNPGPEGYVLAVNLHCVVVAGSDAPGAFYGLQSLRQLIANVDGDVNVRGVQIRDWPHKPFRGIKLYVPGRAHIPFFKRFLRDFMALYKFNRCVLEMNAVMRLDRHPELNAGAVEFARDLHATRRERPSGPGGQGQDSTHHDAGDGGLLDKDEVAELVRFARQQHIEVIPELPSLTHSYYLLSRHRELAEIQEAEWPDTYCPLQPDAYDLLFDVLDEYIEVMKPKTMHLGHDEWRMPVNVCPRCNGKDYRELFARDIRKIHDHLASRNVKMAIWGDHLLTSVRGKEFRRRKSSSGYEYQMPGGLSAEQVQSLIPKDILIFNWFWNTQEEEEAGWNGEENGLELAAFGFKQIYGNFRPVMQNYGRRSSRPDVLGGVPSSWAATTEFNFGKDLMNDLLGCANLLWSTKWPEPRQLIHIVQSRMPEVRGNLSGESVPSGQRDAIVPVDLTAAFNTSRRDQILGSDLTHLRSGLVRRRRIPLMLADSDMVGGKCVAVVGVQGEKGNSLPKAVEGIQINRDASSLIFLHACVRKARNERSYRYIYNFDDTADLLGWYEVVYEDGFIETIPIRYGVNILQWDVWADGDTATYCYAADPVACSADPGHPLRFFVYEWVNPRRGRIIKQVRLKGSSRFRGLYGKVAQDNAIVLAAMSVVGKRRPRLKRNAN